MDSQDDTNEWSDIDRLCPVEVTGRLLGSEAATLLIEHFGGLSLYFPKNPPPSHSLSLILGHSQALALGSEIGGITLNVPRRAHRRLIDLVARMSRSGCDVASIAIEAGCTERHVYGLRAKLRQQGRLP